MSLSLREHVVIGLAPDQLSALRIGSLLHPGLRERYALALNAANGAPRDSLMAAVDVLLEQPSWSARDLTMVLSSHYVHYAVTPGGRNLGAAEHKELALLVFRNVFGELINEWDVRVSPSGDQPSLASAVPQTFLKAVRDACDGRGRLKSIQPALMAVFNSQRKVIGQGSGTLALVESGRITLATIENGQWHSVISRAARSNSLSLLLAEESELHGRASGGLLWLCDLTHEAQLPFDSPWRVQPLKPPGMAANGVESLADWGVP